MKTNHLVREMLLFLDTEYTGFNRRPKLISMALVSEDGHKEFYVELADTWAVEDCSQFAKDHVLPLLQGPAVQSAVARQELLCWISNGPRSVQVACDSATDFGFLLELVGDARPRNLRSDYYDLRPLVDTTVYHRTVLAYYENDDREHHALADARAYRHGWLAWMDAKKKSSRR